MLHHVLHHVGGLLLVLVDDYDRLCVVGHLLVNDGCDVGWILERTEEFLDFLLGVVNVYVTYNDNCLVVGMIPLLVVIAQFLRLEVVDYRHESDREALAILRSRVEFWQVALEHTVRSTGAQTPLLVDNSALLVNLLGVEQQSVRPVAEDKQT